MRDEGPNPFNPDDIGRRGRMCAFEPEPLVPVAVVEREIGFETWFEGNSGMELRQLRRILDELEPGLSLSVPRDWTSLNIEGADEAERDLNTLELVLEHSCTWERNPDGNLTFTKSPAVDP